MASRRWGVVAANAEALRTATAEKIASVVALGAEVSTIALTVQMPCGERYHFRTVADIPEETLLCRCGDPEHHVIRYTEQG